MGGVAKNLENTMPNLFTNWVCQTIEWTLCTFLSQKKFFTYKWLTTPSIIKKFFSLTENLTIFEKRGNIQLLHIRATKELNIFDRLFIYLYEYKSIFSKLPIVTIYSIQRRASGVYAKAIYWHDHLPLFLIPFSKALYEVIHKWRHAILVYY